MRTLHLTTSPHLVPNGIPAGSLVTPNPRAAAALGVPFVSLDALARGLLRSERLQVASELARRRALRRALRWALDPDDLEGAVRRFAPTVRELLRAGIEAAPADDLLTPRAHEVVVVARRYRALLAAVGQLDPAEVLWAAAPRVGHRRPIELIGYPRLGGGEIAFVDALAAEGSRLLLPLENGGAAQALALRGWQLERSAAPPGRLGDRAAERFVVGSSALGPPLPEVEAWRFDGQDAEVRAVLTRVKQLLYHGVPHQRIGLIARDEAAYGPPLEAVAWEVGVPLVASHALPLRETRFGAWLAVAAEVVRERAPFEATARLLSHPLSGGLEAAAWAAARRDHPSEVAAWSELDPRVAVLDWPGHERRSALLERLFAALARFGVRERAGSRGRDALAALRFGAAAQALADPADEPVAVGVFLGEMLELLQVLNVPRGAGRVGVELHTPLAVYGADVDHLFVLGMAEGVTPAPVRDDPLLDFFERSRLAQAGLPLEGALEAAEREATSFAAMLRSAGRSLVLTFPRTLAGRPRIVSPYLARLGLTPLPPPARPAASPEEARRLRLQRPDVGDGSEVDDVLAGARRAWRVELRRESEAPPDHHDGVIGVGRDPDRWIFSASQLVALGQCPFKWFAARLLRLAEPEEADDEVGPLLRGRLWHRTLKTALRRAVPANDPRAAALEQLGEAFAESEAELGAPATPGWRRRRLEHLQQLRHALASDAFWPAGAQVVALEERFEAPWRGLRVQGVVDRIDRGEDGLRLVDYKTRASLPDGAKDAGGRTRLDVQLPLYLEAAAPTLFPGEPVAAASYYSLSSGEDLRRPRSDDGALEELALRVRRHLEEGSYPVDPDWEHRACATCDFDALCRRGPRLERKRQARGEA